jgi:hypothetical protein
MASTKHRTHSSVRPHGRCRDADGHRDARSHEPHTGIRRPRRHRTFSSRAPAGYDPRDRERRSECCPLCGVRWPVRGSPAPGRQDSAGGTDGTEPNGEGAEVPGPSPSWIRRGSTPHGGNVLVTPRSPVAGDQGSAGNGLARVREFPCVMSGAHGCGHREPCGAVRGESRRTRRMPTRYGPGTMGWRRWVEHFCAS